MKTIRVALAALLSASLAAPAPAQAPPAPVQPAAGQAQAAPAQAGQPLTFAVGTGSVAVDVVVRDKKGNLVKDLTQADFEVTEDGRKQVLESFTVIARGAEGELADSPAPEPNPASAGAPAAAPAPAPSEANDQPAVVAFVFDRMGAEGRNMALKAAQTYLAARRDGDYAAVFSIDLSLHMLQNFTNDPDQIRAAFEAAGAAAGTTFASAREKASQLLDLETRTQNAETTMMQAAGPGMSLANVGLAGGAAAARDMAAITVRMLRGFESLEREQQGYATSNSLLAVVQGMARVPGRKTVVFFSEGMAIPSAVQAQFMSVIHTANRANVAIYTMDAGGLRTQSVTEETRREMLDMQRRRFENLGNEDELGIMMKDSERNEDLLRLNPQAGLGQLASGTGGFMIRDTNDARGSFRKIAQDMRFHYVLGYTPSKLEYDGRFREISVKVKRGGVDVFARRGYFAIKPGESSPLLPYELPAVAVLDGGGTPREAFAIRLQTLSFPRPGTRAEVPVLVEIPGQAVKYVPDPQRKGQLAADVAVVARIRNEYQQEVSRLSQHFQLSAESDKLAKAQSGSILFYRQAELPAGRYTLETIVYDANTKGATVRRQPLEVPGAATGGARMSSLMIIDRVERVPDSERDPKNPLYFGEVLLYPNLGTPLRKATTPAVGFYFTAQDASAAKKALVEVVKDGQPAGRLTMDLPAPDESGRVQHAGALPLTTFGPGQYELRVSLLQGETKLATRTAPFAIAE